jgi:hypothetical protein
MIQKPAKPYLPFLDRTEVGVENDGTLVVRGVFDDMEEKPILLRLGEDRQPFQTDEALRALAENAAEDMFKQYRQGWRDRNKLGNVIGHMSIEYDEGDEVAATSYECVLVSVNGTPTKFATGNPVADHAAAMKWAARNVGQLMTSSSLDHFASDVVGFCWGDGDVLQHDPSDTVERRRAEREAEAARESSAEPASLAIIP